MTNLERRLQGIQSMAEQTAEDCQIAQVQALCEIARQVARLVRSHQFENGLEAEDPDDDEQETIVIEPQIVLED